MLLRFSLNWDVQEKNHAAQNMDIVAQDKVINNSHCC